MRAGARRRQVPIYGSGGFTSSYERAALRTSLGGWVQQGVPRVKMNSAPTSGHTSTNVDVERKIACGAPGHRLCRGAIRRRQWPSYDQASDSLMAEEFAQPGVRLYFEEPVSSDDLRRVSRLCAAAFSRRSRQVKYGFDHWYFGTCSRLIAVDILGARMQTRCLSVSKLCGLRPGAPSFDIPFSAHLPDPRSMPSLVARRRRILHVSRVFPATTCASSTCSLRRGPEPH